MNRKLGLLLTVSLFVLMVGVTACNSGGKTTSSKQAEGPKSTFPDKDINFVVPVSPGGRFDAAARLFAPYLQKHLPKPVNVVVENVPGGNYSIGINKVYRAKPDGYTIGIFNIPGNLVNPILGVGDYDLTKITWIGDLSDTPLVQGISAKSKNKSLEDLKKASEVTAGITGVSGTDGLGTVIMAQQLGLKLKAIPHEGSTETLLAAAQGNVELVMFPYATMKNYLESKDILPLWVYSKQRLPQLPDTPTILELGYSEELLNVTAMFQPLGTTPGVHQDVAKVLRDAYSQAIKDPDFIAAAKKANIDPATNDAEQTAKIIQTAADMVNKYADIFKQYKQ